MRSSSELFPVGLIAADSFSGLDDDGYLLHPGVSSDPSVRVGVTRVSDPAIQHKGTPVVLLHPEFCNRYHWLQGPREGFAGELLRDGLDVWLAEMRGHGRSPRNHRWAATDLLSLGREDWWPTQRFVREQSGDRKSIWIAQGASALSLLHALAKEPGFAGSVAALVLIEPGRPQGYWLQESLSAMQRWQLRRKPAFGGPWGPEVEPSAVIRQLLSWRVGRKGTEEHPVFDQLPIRVPPTLCVSLGNDEAVRGVAERLPGGEADVLVPGDVGATLTAGTPACDVPIEPMRLEIRRWLQRQKGIHCGMEAVEEEVS